MTTFLFIVACIVWFVALLGAIAGGGCLTAVLFGTGEYKTAVISGVGTILCTAFIVWGGIELGIVTGGDNAEHCGPGTTYRESSRYDAATKTVRTDWVCEANR